MFNYIPKNLRRTLGLILTFGIGFALIASTAHAEAGKSDLGWMGEALLNALMAAISNVITVLGIAIITITSWFLYLSAAFVEQVMFITIIDLKRIIDGLGKIERVWGFFRDVANLVFVFVLIYTGIKLILNINDKSVGQVIKAVIIGALFVNFSLFFTKVIIDVSNMATIELYRLISSEKNGAINKDKSLSAVIMSAFSPQTAITTPPGQLPSFSQSYENAKTILNGKVIDNVAFDTAAARKQGAGDFMAPIQLMIRALFIAITFTVSAISFFILSFLFIQRFMMIIYLLITCPVYFAGYAYPKLRTLFGDWFAILWRQSVFPIIFFSLLFAVLALLSQASDMINNNPVDKNIGASVGWTVGQIIMFVLVMSGFIGAIAMSRKYANDSFSGMASAVKGFSDWTQGRVLRATGMVAGGAMGTVRTVPLVGGALGKTVETVGKPITLATNKVMDTAGASDIAKPFAGGSEKGKKFALDNKLGRNPVVLGGAGAVAGVAAAPLVGAAALTAGIAGATGALGARAVSDQFGGGVGGSTKVPGSNEPSEDAVKKEKARIESVVKENPKLIMARDAAKGALDAANARLAQLRGSGASPKDIAAQIAIVESAETTYKDTEKALKRDKRTQIQRAYGNEAWRVSGWRAWASNAAARKAVIQGVSAPLDKDEAAKEKAILNSDKIAGLLADATSTDPKRVTQKANAEKTIADTIKAMGPNGVGKLNFNVIAGKIGGIDTDVVIKNLRGEHLDAIKKNDDLQDDDKVRLAKLVVGVAKSAPTSGTGKIFDAYLRNHNRGGWLTDIESYP